MNQEKIIAAIAAYLDGDTMDRFKKIYANRLHIKITLGDIFRYQSPPNAWPDDCVAIKSRREEIAFLESELADLKNEIAAEIAAAIAPHLEAGAGWNWNTSNVLPEITNGKYSELLIMKTKEGGYELGHFKDTSKEKYCGLPVAFAINNGSYDEDEMFYEIESVEKWSYIH